VTEQHQRGRVDTTNLNYVVWFAAIYGINPQGFKSIGTPAMAPVLQTLAWDALKKEPLKGLTAAKQ
jgi:hypothetical protein